MGELLSEAISANIAPKFKFRGNSIGVDSSFLLIIFFVWAKSQSYYPTFGTVPDRLGMFAKIAKSETININNKYAKLPIVFF